MTLFTQLAEGLDDETWDFHLTQGDYSRWLREAIKDRDLAGIVANIESDPALSSTESRRQVIEAIRKHYTASALEPRPEDGGGQGDSMVAIPGFVVGSF